MRDCGVVFCRYDTIKVAAGEAGVDLTWPEGTFHADTLVLPEAVRPGADTARLARALRVHVGADGYFQDVNIRYYRPGLSSRPGVFFCGRCHMDGDGQQVATDVAQTAANVDALLGSGSIASEQVVALVDPKVCIRCLTCVRTCPHAAAEITDYTAEAAFPVTAARVDLWACRGCGACAANCPVKAIEMVDADEAPARGVPSAAREALAAEERTQA
jgi:heterodisulfide reductase subunit A